MSELEDPGEVASAEGRAGRGFAGGEEPARGCRL